MGLEYGERINDIEAGIDSEVPQKIAEEESIKKERVIRHYIESNPFDIFPIVDIFLVDVPNPDVYNMPFFKNHFAMYYEDSAPYPNDAYEKFSKSRDFPDGSQVSFLRITMPLLRAIDIPTSQT